jgi:hypothetical protein
LQLIQVIDSIRLNREFDSNKTHESDLQYEKHDDPSISAMRGIAIDSSNDSRNASGSIRFNREFDSNEIDESDSQQKKHDDPIISTVRRISIDRSDEVMFRDARLWDCKYRQESMWNLGQGSFRGLRALSREWKPRVPSGMPNRRDI